MATIRHVKLQSAAIDLVERGVTSNDGSELTPLGALFVLSVCGIQVHKFHRSVVQALHKNGVLTRWNTVAERYNNKSSQATCDSCGTNVTTAVFGFGPGIGNGEMDFCVSCVGTSSFQMFGNPVTSTPPFPQRPFDTRPGTGRPPNSLVGGADSLLESARSGGAHAARGMTLQSCNAAHPLGFGRLDAGVSNAELAEMEDRLSDARFTAASTAFDAEQSKLIAAHNAGLTAALAHQADANLNITTLNVGLVAALARQADAHAASALMPRTGYNQEDALVSSLSVKNLDIESGQADEIM